MSQDTDEQNTTRRSVLRTTSVAAAGAFGLAAGAGAASAGNENGSKTKGKKDKNKGEKGNKYKKKGKKKRKKKKKKKKKKPKLDCPTCNEGGGGPTRYVIAHRPPGNPENCQTLCLPAPAAQAHLDQHEEDTCGPC